MKNITNLLIATKKALSKAVATNNVSFFNNVLNHKTNYFIDDNIKYSAVEITTSTGKINIYINTKTGFIKGFWDENKCKIKLEQSEINFINEFYKSKFECNLIYMKAV